MGNFIFDLFKKSDEITKTRKAARFYEENITIQPFETLEQINVEIQNGNLHITFNPDKQINLKINYASVDKIEKNKILKVQKDSKEITIISEEKILERRPQMK